MRYKIILAIIPAIIHHVYAQDTIYYQISFPNRIHHEAEITLSLNHIVTDSLIFRMSSSSPGRYASHQFAKNVYDVRCKNSKGEEKKIFKIYPDRWFVPEHDGSLSLTYTLFADFPDGTYAGIERDFALLNMPASLIWLENKDQVPIIIEFLIPENVPWKIGTQLLPAGSQNRFMAINLSYLMDSPAVLGNFKLDSISVYSRNEMARTIRIIYHPLIDMFSQSKYTEMVRKIVNEQQAIFGELPDFDSGSYIFLNNYGPAFENDGMEHRNSTLITSSSRLPGNEKKLIGSVAHEFFHCWNVERLRPKSLEPFNFTRANMSGELWFAEGFTSYYGSLTCLRSGIYSDVDFLKDLSSTLNYVINIPGREAGSPVYMSQMAPFIDAATWVDNMNVNNVFISYYNYGMAIALALDLSLRSMGIGISLDDYMKYLWNNYGRKEIPYDLDDLKNALIEVTGDRTFSNDFFNQYILHNHLPDYKKLLALAGFNLKTRFPDRGWIGFNHFEFSQNKGRLLNYPLKGDPLYQAGMEKGDELIRLDSIPVQNDDQLKVIIGHHAPGDSLKVEFLHQEEFILSSIILQPDPELTIQQDNHFNGDVEEFRGSWLSSKIKQ